MQLQPNVDKHGRKTTACIWCVKVTHLFILFNLCLFFFFPQTNKKKVNSSKRTLHFPLLSQELQSSHFYFLLTFCSLYSLRSSLPPTLPWAQMSKCNRKTEMGCLNHTHTHKATKPPFLNPCFTFTKSHCKCTVITFKLFFISIRQKIGRAGSLLFHGCTIFCPNDTF